jgi:RHH-type transcriptional regulator, proline utilization regulon repressor / proline dehydrogenase / delta 1-pyrroline-5-carboxylate dehydrogenase
MKELSFALTDRVLRHTDRRLAAQDFHSVVKTYPLDGLSLVDRVLLKVGGALAPTMPAVVMPLVTRRLRAETTGVILPSEQAPLAQHLSSRQREGFRANVNILGEAIVGNQEADHRLDLVMNALKREEVDYVSVKISSICASISALAFDETVDAVAERLRVLYRSAIAFGKSERAKFVNLDMEEYRDLALTIAVFTKVLSEPEFSTLYAGIVLQAYLPDSHDAAEELCTWAKARHQQSGGQIKIRVVKGANLAMEQVDAELHGWELATFSSKADVDASYKALLDKLLRPDFDTCVDVGLASHNLFDIAWGITLHDQLKGRGAGQRLTFEMLEGMAPEQALAVKDLAGSVLLYSPIVAATDFSAAIAYLVRRLDENTTPNNFLRSVFAISPDNDVFAAEEARFRNAIDQRASLDTSPRRKQDRFEISASHPEQFANEPDTDFALACNRSWINEHLHAWRPPTEALVPIINGEKVHVSERNETLFVPFLASPHDHYQVRLASPADVEDCVREAKSAQARWSLVSPSERTRILHNVGTVIASHRGEILATMAHDAGKTISEGDPEISEAVDFAHYYAEQIIGIETPTQATQSHPLGTVVIAPPWNFPYAIAMGGVLAALAAGNTVILKPAPQTVLTAALVAQHCWEAGVPNDVLQFFPCPDNEVGRQLITHADIDAVILTGAFETAQMFLGWKPTLRLHAETSGKNAIIVAASADIDLAIKDLVKSAFGHAGQKCSAASLAIVHASLYDDPLFRQRLRDAVTTLRVGPGHNLSTDVGPLVEAPSARLLRALTVLDPGEEWLVEPSRIGDDEHLWSPGVRLHVAEGSWLHTTECFGPVLGIMRAENLDHALRLQNATPFGLTAGLHSLDPDEINQWTEQVEAGNLYINRGITGAIVQRQPFGGWKRSVVGPTVKAGGPRYVQSLRVWSGVSSTSHLAASHLNASDATGLAASDATDITAANITADIPSTQDRWTAWAQQERLREVDASRLHSESNVLRLRSLNASVAVRLGTADKPMLLPLIERAATIANTDALVSLDTEAEETFLQRLTANPSGCARVRLLSPIGERTRAAIHAMGICIDDAPMTSDPAIELPRWLREQAVTKTLHRHGHLRA